MVIASPLVELVEEPKRFATSMMRIPTGTYDVHAQRRVSFGGLQEDWWFQIDVDGRRSWVVGDI